MRVETIGNTTLINADCREWLAGLPACFRAALHRSIELMENDPELAGRVPPGAMRAFVDELAAIDRERFAMALVS